MIASEKYNITIDDLCKSDTAIRLGIVNIADEKVTNRLLAVIKYCYEPICNHFGLKLPINSGYRCVALNKAIKGSSTSEHCLGMALDIDGDTVKVSNKEIFEWAKANLQFGQLIWEFGDDKKPAWVHISYNDKLQKECLKAIVKNGKTVYVKF